MRGAELSGWSRARRGIRRLDSHGHKDKPHPDHTVQAWELHRYLCRRNANAQHPYALAAQRRERARIRSEKGVRRGGRPVSHDTGLYGD